MKILLKKRIIECYKVLHPFLYTHWNILMRPNVSLQIQLLSLLACSSAANFYILSIHRVSSYCTHPFSHALRKIKKKNSIEGQTVSRNCLHTKRPHNVTVAGTSVDNTLAYQAAATQKHKSWCKKIIKFI